MTSTNSLCGLNTFSYCNNGPTTYRDSCGNRPIASTTVSGENSEERHVSCKHMAGQLKPSDSNNDVSMSDLFYDSPSMIMMGTGEVGLASPEFAIAAMMMLLLASAINFETTNISNNSNSKNYQYWEASLVGRNVVIGDGLTLTEASTRVAKGNNVMCINQSAAKTLLAINCYWNAVGPEIAGMEGAYWHYHPHRNTIPSVHIWFYGSPN